MSTVLMLDDSLVDKQYWQVAGPAGEGTLMTFAADPCKNPAAAQVVVQQLMCEPTRPLVALPQARSRAPVAAAHPSVKKSTAPLSRS